MNREQAARHDRFLRTYDSSPVDDVDPSAKYSKASSYDGGRTWDGPRPSTGEHLKLDMTEALLAVCSVSHDGDVVTIESPYPMGGLIRYTRVS